MSFASSQQDTTLLDEHLVEIGMCRRELSAEWAKTPESIRGAIPGDITKALVAGDLLPQGFGLGGATGVGKTMAIAALVKQSTAVRLQAHREKTGAPFFPKIVWVCWPETVAWIRSNATSPAVEALIGSMESARLLVIDDLGRERAKGSYADDWAINQLDRIVSRRNREMLPILWTTNVSQDDLLGLYGAPMLSRLLEDAPLVWVDSLPNRRLN